MVSILYPTTYRIGCFVTLIQFNTRDVLEIHYKWMAKIFCSIFIEQSTIRTDIGLFSAISTKHNIVKCNVSCRFGQNNHLTYVLYLFMRIKDSPNVDIFNCMA